MPYNNSIHRFLAVLTKSPYFQTNEEGEYFPPPGSEFLLNNTGENLLDNTDDYLLDNGT